MASICKHSNDALIICDNDCGTIECSVCQTEFHYREAVMILGHNPSCGFYDFGAMINNPIEIQITEDPDTLSIEEDGDVFVDRDRGAFIVFEGLDKSGKTTQSARLAENLRLLDIPHKLIKFPNRESVTGQIIDNYLKNQGNCRFTDKEIHELFAKNRWDMKEQIYNWLHTGTTVIVDRYAYSGVAYSVAKGLDVEWTKLADEGLYAPDLVIFMNITPEMAQKRIGFGEERFEKTEFQHKVMKAYNEFQHYHYWKVFDSTESVELLEMKIKDTVLNKIEDVFEHVPYILKLWN